MYNPLPQGVYCSQACKRDVLGKAKKKERTFKGRMRQKSLRLKDRCGSRTRKVGYHWSQGENKECSTVRD